MGLDMYLYRMPRFEDCTPRDVMTIDSYFHWKRRRAEGSKYANCTLKEWCGVSYNDLKKKAIKFYEPFLATTYSDWDKEHSYPHISICEDVGYWRKANHIHKWFVDNVQDGEDDCGNYEVSQEQLEELLDICKLIKEKSRMKTSRVTNGERFVDGGWKPIYTIGKVIENPEIAEQYLPTQDGFFFGGTQYDQYYMEDIESTIEILTKVLEETNFDDQMIAYHSSW